ncbi:phage tail length tape measure family protein [Caballeronia sp. GaOx3]|uniref:phage tail length tape measure family protein n=1 Tax=Caballeronia sp. GaOx3 TaxID=2921740 RepID=UPI0020285DCA|nr:phage tail length tape measure family protein [Caballeronia sp. GaOx3]
MANEVVTRVSVDASGFEAGMERTKRAANGFVANQQASASKYEACQQQIAAASTLTVRALEEAAKSGSAATVRQVSAAVRGFEKVADTAGKTRFELMRLKAAKLGIAEAAEPLIAKAEAAARAMHHFGAGSVAARRELFVLGHEAMQGGWKNFVGSLMVMAERIDVLPMLCGPAGIALGALGASATVAYHAIHSLTEQQEKLDHAMLLTGNFAALTQGKLQAYSDIISRRVGVSAGDARDALMALAKSGHVAGADMERAAEGVAAFAKASGQSVEETTRQYLQSYGQAAQAARKWREDHHDLSQAQIDHIRIVELSGDKAGAWAAFVEAASKKARAAVAADNREIAESYETLGQKWERFWRTVTGKADDLTKLQDAIASKRSMMYDADANPFGLNTAAIEKGIADLELQKQALLERTEKGSSHQKSVDAFKSVLEHHAEYMKSARSPQEKLADANKETNEYFAAVKKAGEAAGKTREELKALEADRQKMLAHNAELYKPHERKTHEARVDAGARYLEQVREQGAALEAQLHTSDKLTDAQKELARFNEKVEAAKRHIAGADERSLLRLETAIRAQLEHNAALEKANALREVRAKFDERSQHISASLDEFRQTQTQRYAGERGDRDADSMQHREDRDLSETAARYRKAFDDLKRITPQALLNGSEYLAKLADIERGNAEAIEAVKKHYEDLRRVQGDWVAGAKLGVADFFKDTQDKAQTAQHAVVEAMRHIEDAVSKFVTRGKLDMKEFVASILGDLSRLALHQALGNLVERMPFFKLAGHAQGGLIAGPGTGTSDSIPTMLSNGEYVVNAASARQHHALLDAINSNHLSHFASGGPVGASAEVAARSEGAQVHLAVHHHGGGGLSEHDMRALQEWVGVFFDQRLARKMGGQGGGAYLMSQGLLA